MRAALAVLFAMCTTCSLVVSDRTPAYEGACANQEEAATSRYNALGEPGEGPLTKSILFIARDCTPCATEDCVERCILDQTNDHLTLECAACFADAWACATGACVDDCRGDLVDIDECNRCLCNHDCIPELNACAGLPIIACRE